MTQPLETAPQYTTIPVSTWLSDPQYQAERDRYYGVKLDCGHLPTDPTHVWSAGHPSTTGYGEDRDTGKKSCYECCARHEIERAIREGRGFFYLAQRESIVGPVYCVTTWPGNQVSGRVVIQKHWRDNFGGHRVSFRCEVNGEIWSGSGPGVGMYCRIKRTKLKSLHA